MLLILKAAIPIFTISLVLIILFANEPFDCSDYHCWDGIISGETTYEEALKMLIHIYGEQSVTTYDSGLSWYQPATFPVHIETYLIVDKRNIVKEMKITFRRYHQPTVADIIASAGDPMYAGRAEFACTIELIYYPDKHMVVWLDQVYIYGQGRVDPTVLVKSIAYSPSELSWTPPFPNHVLFDWQGYTDYCSQHDQ